VLKLQQKYKDAIGQLKERGKQSRQIGINEIKGGINQILGTFSLNEYEENHATIDNFRKRINGSDRSESKQS
jgi:hypothetical protein